MILLTVNYYLRVTELRDALLKLLLLLLRILIENDVVAVYGELAVFAAHVVVKWSVVLLETHATRWLLARCVVAGSDHELRLVVPRVAGDFH